MNGQVIRVHGVYKYKLASSKYRKITDIYAKIGSISHFEIVEIDFQSRNKSCKILQLTPFYAKARRVFFYILIIV
ncbi:hypothetical protein, partial [Lactobacillus delbrueckii]|uniref:hypothetical protein n=1 Tax=Lactobacillus delbrueckii TaxID=1584 RepID=UPI001F178984